MKWVILILGCVLALYEVVTLVMQIVKKRKNKKTSSGEDDKSSVEPEDK